MVTAACICDTPTTMLRHGVPNNYQKGLKLININDRRHRIARLVLLQEKSNGSSHLSSYLFHQHSSGCLVGCTTINMQEHLPASRANQGAFKKSLSESSHLTNHLLLAVLPFLLYTVREWAAIANTPRRAESNGKYRLKGKS